VKLRRNLFEILSYILSYRIYLNKECVFLYIIKSDVLKIVKIWTKKLLESLSLTWNLIILLDILDPFQIRWTIRHWYNLIFSIQQFNHRESICIKVLILGDNCYDVKRYLNNAPGWFEMCFYKFYYHIKFYFNIFLKWIIIF